MEFLLRSRCRGDAYNLEGTLQALGAPNWCHFNAKRYIQRYRFLPVRKVVLPKLLAMDACGENSMFAWKSPFSQSRLQFWNVVKVINILISSGAHTFLQVDKTLSKGSIYIGIKVFQISVKVYGTLHDLFQQRLLDNGRAHHIVGALCCREKYYELSAIHIHWEW